MSTYHNKGSEIEAHKWSIDSPHPVVKRMDIGKGKDTVCRYCKGVLSQHGFLYSRGQLFGVCPGDFIIKAGDDYYPMSSDVFSLNYK